MNRNVTIRLRGLSGDDTIASEYSGSCFKKDDRYVVFYEERLSDDDPPVKSTLKVDPRELSIAREGMGNTMRFLVGQKTSSIYTTFAGDMTLDIETTKLFITEGAASLKIVCDYKMAINGSEPESKHITIEITE